MVDFICRLNWLFSCLFARRNAMTPIFHINTVALFALQHSNYSNVQIFPFIYSKTLCLTFNATHIIGAHIYFVTANAYTIANVSMDKIPFNSIRISHFKKKRKNSHVHANAWFARGPVLKHVKRESVKNSTGSERSKGCFLEYSEHTYPMQTAALQLRVDLDKFMSEFFGALNLRVMGWITENTLRIYFQIDQCLLLTL